MPLTPAPLDLNQVGKLFLQSPNEGSEIMSVIQNGAVRQLVLLEPGVKPLLSHKSAY